MLGLVPVDDVTAARAHNKVMAIRTASVKWFFGLLVLLAFAVFAPDRAQAAVSVAPATLVPPASSINLSPAAPPPNADWVRWVVVNPANFLRKAPPAGLISTFTLIGGGPTSVVGNPSAPFFIPAFIWNAGTGTPLASPAPPVLRRAVYRGGPGAAIGRGFKFTAAATNTNSRVLTAYVGARSAVGQLTVTLLDPPNPPSAPIPVTLSAGGTYRTWAVPIQYQATGTGGSVEVSWREIACNIPAQCHVNLQAATLTNLAPVTPLDTAIISPGPSTISNDNTPTISFVGIGGVGPLTFQCQYDATAWVPCLNPWTLPPLAEGAHTICVRAVDSTSAVDATPACITIMIDTVAPALAITSPTIGQTVGGPIVNVFFTVFDLFPVTTTCQLDSNPPVPCASPWTIGPLSPGPHTVAVKATDQAGNVSTAIVTFIVP